MKDGHDQHHQQSAAKVSDVATADSSTSRNGLGTRDIAARIVVGDWLATERREYADGKYKRDGETWHRLLLDMQNYGLHEQGEWFMFLTNYLRRAQLLGLDTPAGQQAFGKFVVTCLSCFEACVMVNGRPPMPGVPSGTIEPWKRGDE